MRVGFPHQTTDGIVFFQLDDYTLTVTEILELLDKHRLIVTAFAHSLKQRKNDLLSVPTL